MTDRATILQANADTLRTLALTLNTVASEINSPLLFLLRKMATAHDEAASLIERRIAWEAGSVALAEELSNARAHADEAT